jgi:serine/threonine protein phosphatase PrpC
MLYFSLFADRLSPTQATMPARTSSPLRIVEFAFTTDRGVVRAENQDAAGKFPDGPFDPSYPGEQLFVVADGMGGHNAGREASALALKTIGETFLAGTPSANPGASLKHALETANLRIHDQGLSDPNHRGMGTTCTALLLAGDRSLIAHVGDSRAYAVRNSAIAQLTEDHTRVGELVRAGIITSAQAREHPERSFLNRALGARPTVTVDIIEGPPLTHPCTLVLCSDGLYTHVDDEEIRTAVTARTPDEAARELTALAIQRGGSDNITILIIRVSITRQQGTTTRRKPTHRKHSR